MLYTKNKFMFRGKDVKTGEWLRGFRTYMIDNGEIIPLILNGSKCKAGIFRPIREGSTQLCSQYKDVDGAYYGEGDIVLTNEANSPYRYIDFSHGCFVARGLFEKNNLLLYDFCNRFTGKIVGNLFDYENFFALYNKTYICRENFNPEGSFVEHGDPLKNLFGVEDVKTKYQFREGCIWSFFCDKGEDGITVLNFAKQGEIPLELTLTREEFERYFEPSGSEKKGFCAPETDLTNEEIAEILRELKKAGEGNAGSH